MKTHIHVHQALEEYLERRQYMISSGTFKGNLITDRWRSPLIAAHPQHGRLEIEFIGENIPVDDCNLWISPNKLTRAEQLALKRLEKISMEEEAAADHFRKMVCTVLAKLIRADGTRFGMAFPNTDNFWNPFRPLGRHLLGNGIEIFLVETWGGILYLADAITDLSDPQLPSKNNLLLEGL